MNLTRRQTLAAFGATLATPVLARSEVLESLALFGPPATPSVTLAHAAASGGLASLSTQTSFTAWRNPDELRAGLTSGQMQLAVAPVQAVTNLYNRGFPIKLMNVMTNGLLYVLSADPAVKSIADLDGRKVAVPFPGDTPDILFDQMVTHFGGTPAKESAPNPIMAVQMLLSGRVDAALIPEPAASAAILRGKQAGKTITRAINLQEVWAQMSGGAPVLPQAGLAVVNSFSEAHGELLPALATALETSVEQVLADPMAGAQSATQTLGLPAPLIAQSIPHSNLVVRPAKEARSDIERMLNAMAGDDMARIGGRLPDDGFYL